MLKSDSKSNRSRSETRRTHVRADNQTNSKHWVGIVPAWLWALGLIAVAASVVTLPGLGSYGLWDPPSSWTVMVQREKPGTTGQKSKGTVVSEIALADQARASFQGNNHASTKAPADAAPSSTTKSKATKKTPPKVEEPPLRLWLIAKSLKMFGVHDWSARLPMALSAIVLVILVFVAGTWTFGWKVGATSTLVFMTLPAFIFGARQVTSIMPATLATTAAVMGLAMATWPDRKTWFRAVGAVLALAGLVAGQLGAGPVTGLIMPLTVAASSLAAWLATGGMPKGKGRRATWATTGALTLVIIVLAGITVHALAAGGFSKFLWVHPESALAVRTFAGTKTPPSQLAVFDIILRNLVHGTFPWIALAPIGLAMAAALAWTKGTGRWALDAGTGRLDEVGDDAQADWAPTTPETKESSDVSREKNEPQTDRNPEAQETELPASQRALAGTWLVAWAAIAFLLGTYWNLRFADQAFIGLPAIALACGLAFHRLGSASQPRRIAAAAVVLFIVLMVVRDFMDFPQALAQSQVNYQIQHPEELHVRGIMLLFAALFGAFLLMMLMSRGDDRNVEEPTGLIDWLGGRVEQHDMEQLAIWSWLRGPRSVLGWPVAVAVALMTVAIAWVKTVILIVLWALYFYPLWLMGKLEQGRFVRPADGLGPKGETKAIKALVDRVRTGMAGARFFWGIVAIAVLPIWAVGLGFRIGWYLILSTGLAILIGPKWVWSRRSTGHGTNHDDQRWWAVTVLVAAAVAFAAWLSWAYIPELSRHFSPKAVFATYHNSRDKNHPEPIALYKTESRSADFYNAGHIISEQELNRRYPWSQARVAPLIAYLAEANRVFALVGTSYAGTLEQQTRKAGIPYYVLDAGSHWFMLISNKLGKGQKDRNPLRRLIANEPPQRLGRRINAVFKDPGSSSPNGDIVLLGVEMPNVFYKGHKFPMTFHFKANNDIRGDWKIFIHFDGPGPRFFGDHEPLEKRFTTRFWTKGTYVTDPYVVPPGHTSRIATPGGIYRMWMGFYRGDTRMKVIQGPKDNSNRVNLGVVRVMNRPMFGCTSTKSR